MAVARARLLCPCSISVVNPARGRASLTRRRGGLPSLLALVLLAALAINSALAQMSVTSSDASATFEGQISDAPPELDLRVLIDVSGSMRQTDPTNLRRPALELLVQLLPPTSYAGVWQFGERVTPVVPYGAALADWQAAARVAAQRIDSRERLTDIHAALSRALAAPSRAPQGSRHLLLLTDGKLDIGTDAAKNRAAREQLLREALPQWRALGFHIHTVALSSDADAALMQSLSEATDGVSAVATSADQLMATFAAIFARAHPQEELPLDNNRFMVDKSIREFTVVLLRAEGQATPRLLAPNGTRFSPEPHHIAGAAGGRVKVHRQLPQDAVINPDFNQLVWWQGAGYDLITVTQPVPGTWQMDASVAPGTRVTIVSDFSLKVDPLRTQVAVGDTPAVSFRFVAAEGAVTDPAFLRALTTQLELRNPSQSGAAPLPVAEISGAAMTDGRAQVTLPPLTDTTASQLQIRVDGKSFSRQWQHRFQIHQARFELTSESLAQNGQHLEQLRIRSRLKGATELRASASITRNGEAFATQDAEVDPNAPDELRLEFIATEPGTYAMAVAISALNADGVPLWETKLTEPFTLAPPAVTTKASGVADALLQWLTIRSVWLYGGVLAAVVLLIGLFVLVRRRNIKSRDIKPLNTKPHAVKRNHFAVVPPGADEPAADNLVDSAEASVAMDLNLDWEKAMAEENSEPATPLFPLDDLSDSPADELRPGPRES